MPIRRLAALLVLLLSASAHAQRDPDLFPLSVHVFERSLHKVRHFAAYRGEGKANLIELNQINGFNFTYDCEYKFHSSEGEEFYPARWKKQGLSLEILMGVIGSDTKTHTCELKIMLKDEVYRKTNAGLVMMSPQEYAGLAEARAERAASLAPIDLDPSHYPIQISLMHLNWQGGTVGGMHAGTGQGNIVTPTGLAAVDFSLHCPVVVQTTPEGRYLLAQWTVPNSRMLLLLRSIDVDGAPGATCDVNAVVEPDVYVRSGSGVKAVSQDEYRKRYGGNAPPPL